MGLSKTLIHSGCLGVTRKKGVESRFFALFEDRLDYYGSPQDFHGGEDPRGRLDLNDIVLVKPIAADDKVKGLAFLLKKEEQLDLMCLDDEAAASDAEGWASALAKVVPYERLQQLMPENAAAPQAAVQSAIVLEGTLSIDRKGTVSPRHFVLHPDCLEYFESLEDCKTAASPRGRVMLHDVEDIQATEKGVSMTIHNRPNPLELKWDAAEDSQRWMPALHELTAAQAQKKSQAQEGGSAPSAKGASSSIKGPAGHSGIPHAIMAGNVYVFKKGKPEPRYMVLFKDRFEYFNSIEHFQKDPNDPRCRVPVDQPIGFNASDLDFVVRLYDRDIQIRVSDEQQRKEWASAWCEVGMDQKGQPPPSPPSPKSTSASTAAPLTPSPVMPSPESDAPLSATAPPEVEHKELEVVTRREREEDKESEQKTKPAKIEPPKKEKDEEDVSEQHKGPKKKVQDRQQQKEEVAGSLIAGTLTLPRKTKAETRFVVMYQDKISVFMNAQELQDGEEPRAVMFRDDISDLKATQKGFAVELDGKHLEFQCKKSEDIEKWVEAWKRMDEPASAHCNAANLLIDGYVHIGPPKKQVKRYFLLFDKYFEYHVDEQSMRSGKEPALRAKVADVESITLDDTAQCFSMQLSDKAIQIRAGKDTARWQQAWEQTAAGELLKRGTAERQQRLPVKDSKQRSSPQSATMPQAKAVRDPSLASLKKNIGTKVPDSRSTSSTATPRTQDGHSADKSPPPLQKDPGQVMIGKVVGVERDSPGKSRSQTQKYLEVVKASGGCRLQFFDSREDASAGAEPTEILVSSIRMFKVTDTGFIISTDKRELRLKVPAADIETWVNAFREIFRAQSELEADPKSPPHSPRSVMNSPRSPSPMRRGRSEEPRPGSAKRWSTSAIADGHLQKWLDDVRTKDPYLIHGLLGVQPKGELVTGYFVLFRDRLDFWNRPSEAAAGLRPRGRILLSEVRSFETVSTGLIVNYKGRKMGLHVKSNEELQDWSRAFIMALAPTYARDSPRSASPSSSMKRSRSEPGLRGKQMTLNLDRDSLERMRSQFRATLGNIPAARFFRGNLISSDDIKRAFRIAAQRSGEACMVAEVEIDRFVAAMNVGGTGHGQVDVDRLVHFIEHGAAGRRSSSPNRRPNSRMPPTWVPRVATLAAKGSNKGHYIDPEEEAMHGPAAKRNSVFKLRSQGKAVFVPVPPRRKHGGQSWKSHDFTEKVNIPDTPDENASPIVKRLLPCADDGVADKITGHENRVISIASPPGHHQWTKINHFSADTHADPETMRTQVVSKPEEMPAKIGTEDRKPLTPRYCLTEKVTEAKRQPYVAKATDATNVTDKIVASARTCVGWAQPYSEPAFDKARTIEQKAKSVTPRSPTPRSPGRMADAMYE